jgi:flagellar basal-body rod protein FlgB
VTVSKRGIVVQNLTIYSLGHERNRWLAARVSAIATNVANADTPGYKARDVAPFEAVLSVARVEMGRTNPRHMLPDGGARRSYDFVARTSDALKHSGNAVSLETEMASLGESRSLQAAVTGILGAFHRLLLSSAKG